MEDLPAVPIKEDNPLDFQNIFGRENEIKISIREDDDGDDVRITVKDDGSDESHESTETDTEEIARYKFPTF